MNPLNRHINQCDIQRQSTCVLSAVHYCAVRKSFTGLKLQNLNFINMLQWNIPQLTASSDR